MNQAISAREFSGWAEPTARRNFRGYAGVFGAIVISSTFAQLLRYLSLREIRLALAQKLAAVPRMLSEAEPHSPLPHRFSLKI